MSDPIDPASGVAKERRAKERRRTDRRQSERRRIRKLLLPAAPPAECDDGPGEAAFTAQLLGQEGQKRGLRGGVPVLEEARHAYLDAEWLGRSDRRQKTGKTAKTDI